MSDQLLPLYDQELAYLRQLAGEFADAHPKIAGRLRLSADAVDDPHVARLIEGFALIAARIRQKLDDDFPELTDSLLGALYPHMLAPFPSASVAQFSPLPDIGGQYRIARHTALEMEPIAGEACRYRTTHDVALWPVRVAAAELGGRARVGPPRAWSACASSCTACRSTPPGCTNCCAIICSALHWPIIRKTRARCSSVPAPSPRRGSLPMRACCPIRPARSMPTGCSANTSRSRRNSCSSISRA
jgi:type VI secretion system protein ImpG